uniref:Putative tail protein n=1 Tax=viral metagenome TaxID=1070528 RepID=A0A6H1ZEL6_9ZZZZ
MPTSLGDAVLDLRADDAALTDDIEGAKGKALSALNSMAALGGAIMMGLIAVVAASVVAIGMAVWSAGNQVDEAYDKILVRTGATGETLKTLQGDFNTVFSSVPTNAGTAADVIGVLNSRLGLSGVSLQNLARPLLEVSRLLGTDATTNAESFTRVMGDWSITNEDAAGTLDLLFKATQETGVGMDKLMTNIVQFGAPMRLMGFTVEDSIALFAKWEQEGVNAELVMGSLRIAAGNFAREGKPLRESLLGTFETIKNNTDGSAALALAMEVFGARAGPDMAAAIREGRFDIEDLTVALAGAEGAIMDTAAATMDWGERFTMFKNKMTLALAPAGEMVMAAASKIMDAIATAFDRPEVQAVIEKVTGWIAGMAEGIAAAVPVIIDWLFKAFDWLKNNKGVIIGVLAAIGVAIGAFVYTTVIPAAIAAISALAPILLIMAAVAAVAYLVYEAWTNNWGGIQTTVMGWWAAIQPVLQTLVEWLQTNIPLAIQALSDYWNNVLLPAIQTVWDWVQTNVFPIIQTLVDTYIAYLIAWIQTLADIWQNYLLPAIQAVWIFVSGTLWPLFVAVARFLGAVFGLVLTVLAGIWQNVLLPTLQIIWNFIANTLWPLFKAVADFLGAVFGLAITVLAGIWQNVLLPAIKTIFEWIAEKLQPVFEALSTFINDTVMPVIRTLGEWLSDHLKPAFEGISTAIGIVVGWITTLTDKIKNIKLPDWLTPGSPTPFEMGLWGISEALRTLSKANLPDFQSGLRLEPIGLPSLGMPALALAGAGGQGGGGEGVTQNFYFKDNDLDEYQLRRAMARWEFLNS